MSRTGRGTFVVLRVKVATKRNIIVDYPIVIVKRSKITETKTELVGNHATRFRFQNHVTRKQHYEKCHSNFV